MCVCAYVISIALVLGHAVCANQLFARRFASQQSMLQTAPNPRCDHRCSLGRLFLFQLPRLLLLLLLVDETAPSGLGPTDRSSAGIRGSNHIFATACTARFDEVAMLSRKDRKPGVLADLPNVCRIEHLFESLLGQEARLVVSHDYWTGII